MTIGLDLGTANVEAHVRGRGTIVQEPSVLALDARSDRVLAVGRQARELAGRAQPGRVRLVYPIRDGLVGDLENARHLVGHLMRRALGWRWKLRPDVVLSFPVGTSSLQKRSLIESVLSAGASKAQLVPHPLAAARGAGLPVSEPRGSVVVDLGASHTEIALLSMGGVVASTVAPIGGLALDAAIAHYLISHHQLEVSPEMAEEIKIRAGSAWPLEPPEGPGRAPGRARPPARGVPPKPIEALGRDLETGLPKRLLVTPEMTREALARSLQEIGRNVMLTLEHTPPALADDIVEHGLVLTGGGAALSGLCEFLYDLTQLPTRVATDPAACAAVGALELRRAGKS